MEEILLNPNLVYLFIIGGFSLAFMAILAPGTGILEIMGLFLLLLAGWGVFNLPLNYWALALLIVGGIGLIVVASRRPQRVPHSTQPVPRQPSPPLPPPRPQAPRCRYCGATVRAQARFCPECGRPIE